MVRTPPRARIGLRARTGHLSSLPVAHCPFMPPRGRRGAALRKTEAGLLSMGWLSIGAAGVVDPPTDFSSSRVGRRYAAHQPKTLASHPQELSTARAAWGRA